MLNITMYITVQTCYLFKDFCPKRHKRIHSRMIIQRRAHLHTNAPVWTHTHGHTCTYTCAHTYTHTHTHTQPSLHPQDGQPCNYRCSLNTLGRDLRRSLCSIASRHCCVCLFIQGPLQPKSACCFGSGQRLKTLALLCVFCHGTLPHAPDK